MAVFALVLAVANAGVITQSIIEPLVQGTALQGPSTRTTVVGPDGSHIEAVAPGGRVETAVDVGLAAHTAPAAYVAHAAPAVVAARYASPYLAAPYAAVPTVHGVVSSAYGLAPSVYSHNLIASPLTASGYPLLAAGSGLEGQYIPDYTEKLYDDGSYKGEIYHWLNVILWK